MYQFPIGVVLDCFPGSLKERLSLAEKLGLKGVQVYGIEGEISPEMTVSARAEFKKELADRGLTLSAVCGDLGHGFFDPEHNKENIERSKRILELAKELGTDVVTTHIGVVPKDPSHPRYGIMQDACGQLAEYANQLGSHFAIETGPEPANVLRKFLDTLPSDGVGVNLDPANLHMCFNCDAAEAVRILKPYIVHTHAKDGVYKKFCDSEIMYGILPLPADYQEEDYCEEVPLGQGGVNWKEYLSALDGIGYRGFLTIERETGDDPAGDIRMAADFLRAQMK